VAVDLEAAADSLLSADAPIVDVGPWLAAYIESAERISDLEAAEEADRKLRRFRVLIDTRLEHARRRRVVIPYRWSDPDRRQLEHVEAYAEGLAALARRLGWREQIQTLLTQLDWREFELLALHLLDLYGIPDSYRKVTPRSDEGGIDFYGLEETDLESVNRIRRQRFRIVGQAKRYVGVVTHDDMDAFAWRLTAFRFGSGRRWDRIESWFRDEADEPIFGMFITTGTFNKAALATARTALIICIDGDQIAQDLSESPAVEKWVDEGDQSIDLVRLRLFLDELNRG
jgi:hypothetical protein